MADMMGSAPAGTFGHRVGVGAQAALLIIDLNLGFTDPASPLSCPLEETVVAVAALLDAARANGAPVVYTTVAYTAEDRETASVFMTKVPALGTLEAGSRWVEIDPRIAPVEGEHVITKLWASSFWGTDLAEWLAERGVDTLVVTGASTSGCVRASVVDAVQHNLRALVPREGVGDRSASAGAQALADLDGRYGDVVGLDEALAAFSPRTQETPA